MFCLLTCLCCPRAKLQGGFQRKGSLPSAPPSRHRASRPSAAARRARSALCHWQGGALPEPVTEHPKGERGGGECVQLWKECDVVPLISLNRLFDRKYNWTCKVCEDKKSRCHKFIPTDTVCVPEIETSFSSGAQNTTAGLAVTTFSTLRFSIQRSWPHLEDPDYYHTCSI